MATAKELFDSGRLQAAIEAVSLEVKSKPSEVKPRTFLFELLCFAGEFDRAERQLDAIGHQSAQSELGVQVYRNNLNAERNRRRLFEEGLEPHFLAEPPAYVDLHLQAINCLRTSNLDEVGSLLDRAEEERPALVGRMNGEPFSDFRDCDDVMGPVLELIVKDDYAWLPFEQIRRLEIPRPKRLRDLMWAPVQIEGMDGTIGEVYIPALYTGSSDHTNEQVKLGRMTEWKKIGPEMFLGAGLRLFMVEGVETILFEATNVEFDQLIDATVGRPPS